MMTPTRLLSTLFLAHAHAFSSSSTPSSDSSSTPSSDSSSPASHLLGVTFGSSVTDATPMQKHMMPDKGLSSAGAVCLDGSDAGFYFSAATSSASASSWQIYFEGGGWCYDENDCWGRSQGQLGSSKDWPPTVGAGGIMSSDCNVNPTFCSFNRVYLKYCDGNSFSGDRTEPVRVVGPTAGATPKPLYFRGRRILDAVLDTLAAKHGLTNATDVLLTGCSAGGLATYLHTDYVGKRLATIAPRLARYKAAPISGFFLRHANIYRAQVYPTEMKYIFEMSNASYGVNAACVAAQPPESKWECNFAESAFAFTVAPIFPLNSALDSWQTACIFASAIPDGFPAQNNTDNGECNALDGWTACAADPEKCNASGIETMNGYMQDFASIMKGKATYFRPGNGAFIHSCHTHCEAQNDAMFMGFAVANVTMRQAVAAWWAADRHAPASEHSYSACAYKESTPHMCNPTCAAA